jgi:WD40 repeat protein
MLRSTAAFAVVLATTAVASAQPAPRLDAYGDPLPDGALLRVGTVRLRTGGNILSMVFTPDNKKLVTANRTTGVHIWDVATGKELHAQRNVNKDQPELGSGPYSTMVLSPDGSRVAEVNNQGICMVYDVAKGAELFKVGQTPWIEIRLVRFTPDGKSLALMKGNGEVDLYEVPSGKLLRTLPCEKHTSYYPFMAFTPDGKTIAVAALTSLMVLYDVATGKKLSEIGNPKDEGTYASATFSPDGKKLAALGNFFQRLDVWDAATGKRLVSIRGHFGWPDRLTFTPDGGSIIATSSEGVVNIWDLTTGKLADKLDEWAGWFSVTLSPDGKTLATSGSTIVDLWDLATRKKLHDFPSHRGHSINVLFAADGKTVHSTAPPYVHGMDQSITIWDVATGKTLGEVGWKAGGSWAAGALSRDGRIFAKGRVGQKLTVEDLAGKKVLLETDESPFAPHQLALTPDGKYLAAMLIHPTAPGGGYKFQLWDVAGGRKVLELEDNAWGFFDPSGRRLMILRGQGEKSQVTCHDLATGRKLPRATLKPVMPGFGPAVSPDGRLAAEAPWPPGGAVAVREFITGQVVTKLASRGYGFATLSFSPGNRLVAGATTAGPIVIWDLLTGEVLAEMKGHRCYVSSVSWSPDGTRLVSGSQDMTMLVWDARPWQAQAGNPRVQMTPKQLDAFWEDLAQEDGSRAYTALSRLVRSPKETVAWIREHVPPAAREEVTAIKALAADLNSDKFVVRQKAQSELAKLGDSTVGVLETLLASKPGLEVTQRAEKLLQIVDQRPPPASCLRQLRALHVLELIATAEARELVDRLAAGEPEAWLTREALAVKQRLAEGKGR